MRDCCSTFFSGAVAAKVKRLLFTIALYQGSVVVPRWRAAFFFLVLGEILPKIHVPVKQRIFVKKLCQQRFFFYWNCHIQTVSFSRSPKYINLFLLSSLTSSQIWLIPPVDDRQCDYITQLKLLVKRLFFMVWVPPFSRWAGVACCLVWTITCKIYSFLCCLHTWC